MKTPYLAAVFNFVLPGLGYVHLQKRLAFGWLMLTASILGNLLAFTGPQSTDPLTTYDWLAFGVTFIASFAFAYDAYQLGSER